VQAKGVDEMDMGAFGLELVEGPVPPIGGLQGHLGIGAGFGQGQGQGHGVVVDLIDAEDLAGLVHANDHRAAPV